jgi:tRNA-splicing ligase RtcB
VGQTVQCHHNYVAQETYDGVDVLVTRKGAIRAGAGDLGLIPGSMGTGSYVVRGLGNVGVLLLGVARRRAADVAERRRKKRLHRGRPRRADGGCRVPQGRRCGR